MKPRALATLVLSAVLAVPAWSQVLDSLQLELTPRVLVPIADSSSVYSIGGEGLFQARLPLPQIAPFFPLLEAGYGLISTPASKNLSLLTAGAGAGAPEGRGRIQSDGPHPGLPGSRCAGQDLWGTYPSPTNAAALAFMSTASISGSDPFTSSPLAPGSVLTFYTYGGLYGKMEIVSFNVLEMDGLVVHTNVLTFNLVVYEADGITVHLSTSGEKVWGTYAFDVDTGTQTTSGADFWWSITSSTVRAARAAERCPVRQVEVARRERV